jgi:hypothetical protein
MTDYSPVENCMQKTASDTSKKGISRRLLRVNLAEL